jgi:TPR repeat protein
VVEAERWLLQAASQNSALAWNNLGTLYAMRHQELKNRWDDAQDCWKRASELGFDCAHPYPPT